MQWDLGIMRDRVIKSSVARKRKKKYGYNMLVDILELEESLKAIQHFVLSGIAAHGYLGTLGQPFKLCHVCLVMVCRSDWALSLSLDQDHWPLYPIILFSKIKTVLCWIY